MNNIKDISLSGALSAVGLKELPKAYRTGDKGFWINAVMVILWQWQLYSVFHLVGLFCIFTFVTVSFGVIAHFVATSYSCTAHYLTSEIRPFFAYLQHVLSYICNSCLINIISYVGISVSPLVRSEEHTSELQSHYSIS